MPVLDSKDGSPCHLFSFISSKFPKMVACIKAVFQNFLMIELCSLIDECLSNVIVTVIRSINQGCFSIFVLLVWICSFSSKAEYLRKLLFLLNASVLLDPSGRYLSFFFNVFFEVIHTFPFSQKMNRVSG